MNLLMPRPQENYQADLDAAMEHESDGGGIILVNHEEPADTDIKIAIDSGPEEDFEFDDLDYPVTKDNWHRHHRRLRAKAGLKDPAEDSEKVENVEEEDDFEDQEFTGWR